MQISGSYPFTATFDPELAELIHIEENRQLNTINLIASENYSSPVTRELEGSLLADKNAEGYPGQRFTAGCEQADAIEELAIQRLKDIFGCEHANVQAMSATVANVAVMRALLEPGDVLLSMKLADGGHLSHGAPFHFSGQDYSVVHYGVERETELVDYDEVARLAEKHRPKIIICGTSSYPLHPDFEKLGTIAKSVNALLWADIAHTIGLVVAGLLPSPVPFADIITSSTHKTLRGPRGSSIILCRKELAQKIDRGVFPGVQGAPKMDMIASRAALFKESQSPEFKVYCRHVLENAQALASGLKSEGIRLVGGKTETHLVLADVSGLGLTGEEAQNILSSCGIITNRNVIPFDPAVAKTGSGIRLGSPAMTTRGFDADDFDQVARMISLALHHPGESSVYEEIRIKVNRKTANRPLFHDRWLPTSIRDLTRVC